jgi:hypothetical protein
MSASEAAKRFAVKAFNEERLEIKVIGQADTQKSAELIGRFHLDVLANDWDGFFIEEATLPDSERGG